jgi:hypothetical protein
MTGSKGTKITGRRPLASIDRSVQAATIPLMEREFGLTIVFSFITPEETSEYQT